jgi:hypothetical protein
MIKGLDDREVRGGVDQMGRAGLYYRQTDFKANQTDVKQ